MEKDSLGRERRRRIDDGGWRRIDEIGSGIDEEGIVEEDMGG